MAAKYNRLKKKILTFHSLVPHHRSSFTQWRVNHLAKKLKLHLQPQKRLRGDVKRESMKWYHQVYQDVNGRNNKNFNDGKRPRTSIDRT